MQRGLLNFPFMHITVYRFHVSFVIFLCIHLINLDWPALHAVCIHIPMATIPSVDFLCVFMFSMVSPLLLVLQLYFL
jgi:hypothetical protein